MLICYSFGGKINMNSLLYLCEIYIYIYIFFY